MLPSLPSRFSGFGMSPDKDEPPRGRGKRETRSVFRGPTRQDVFSKPTGSTISGANAADVEYCRLLCGHSSLYSFRHVGRLVQQQEV
jgi:hypothetical protein